ncbi:MAG: MoxR family ATPase [Eubacterium sp.]|nr:MoxR family ATPase [Eubacterium sp.]
MQEKIVLLKENITKRFIGKDEVVHNLMVALLAGGHVLIEDVPGVGKTTLAKALAMSVKADFARIQFTPDTLPTDVTGTSIFDKERSEFRVVKGPIVNDIILADEINRTSPRTQSALLEAMEERQVTIDGKTFKLSEIFMVIATQNPSEQIGTYPLPEAELDRFMMMQSIGYPDKAMQQKMAKSFLTGEFEQATEPVLTVEDIMEMKKAVKNVIIKDEMIDYALKIVDDTRRIEELEYGLSPRAGLDLLAASRANAFVEGRDYVIPEDIIRMAGVTLPHRLVLTAKAHMNKYTGQQLITRVVDSIKRPE